MRKQPLNPFDLIDGHVKKMNSRVKTAHYASQVIACPRASWFGFKDVAPSNPRSEEHTSELQSH